jgi:surface antigen
MLASMYLHAEQFQDALTRKKRFLHDQREMSDSRKQPTFVHVVVKLGLVAMLGLFFLGISYGTQAQAAHASSAHTSQASMPSTGSYNWFPYPYCTWWADHRYHQIHGVYVPWRGQSNAWQWTARAYQFGWRVSTRASYGAIIDLQPWVQGAYGLGHVAVVERVYSDGSVLASNMSWGRNRYAVVYVHFHPGRGVTFIQW